MDLIINGSSARIYTGGRTFDHRLPAVVLIHGAEHDHSVWNLQARHLAHHGFSVLAPDLPGHGRSGGGPLSGIDACAAWIIDLLDAAGVRQARLAGHSMGSLIALAATARAPERIAALALLGSVAPMPVAPALLEAAASNRDQAHALINQWSYTPANLLGASPLPGVHLAGANLRLMERQAEGVLAADLAACNAWADGLAAAARVRCPALLLCGGRDQMTPPRAAKPLCDALVNVTGGARLTVLPDAGHAMMAETPDAVSDALRGFFASS